MGENALIYTIDDDAMWGRRQTVHTKVGTPELHHHIPSR